VAVRPDLAHVDVRYIADLARLELTEAEVARFQAELDDILGYVDQLRELDVEGV
jgi:aspartyl-tRNA(Asn)/glutamyl-tRNA(Gln) amidotransferase subunit C